MMDNFNNILEAVYQKAPLQKKKLAKHFEKRNQSFFQEAEEFSTDYIGYLNAHDIPLTKATDAYVKLCNDMMESQFEFIKTGRYPVAESSEAYEHIYSNKEEMTSYMIGLAVSQFLWETHYDMYSFLDQHLKSNAVHIKTFLEIGPGHGLFLNKALSYLSDNVEVTAVDISPVSIDITKSIIKHFKPNQENVRYVNKDMLDLDLGHKFDFITMGEVLEHVNHPEKLLTKLRDLLTPTGKAFVSTCANAPAIDHVYHFKSAQEIRDMFSLCGFSIQDERVLPVEDLPMEEIVKQKIAVNYCAILTVTQN